MHSIDTDGMTNNADPEKTDPWEQSDVGLHCLL